MVSDPFLLQGMWMRSATCPNCKVLHAFPEHVYKVAMERRADSGITCPNGHGWHYRPQAQINEEAEIRRERDRLKQQMAQRDDEVAEQRRKVADLERKAAAAKKRASAGVCPCCSRTFQNVARHMATKHSEITHLPKKRSKQ